MKIPLNEENYKDLRSNANDFLNTRAKSKKTPGTSYKSITGNKILFITPSHTDTGKHYIQTVILKDLPTLIEKYKTSVKPIDIVRKAMLGDILIDCTCPAWLYWGFKYKGTKYGYSAEKEIRPPKERNPGLKGSTCKHLDNAMYVLPFLATRITADLIKQGIFK